MKAIKDLSVSSKLTILTAIAATLALLVACGFFLVYDMRVLKASKIRQLQALGELVASNSTAAVSFGSDDSATDLLHSFEFHPTIVDARIYDTEKLLFAQYSRSEADGQIPYTKVTIGWRETPDGSLEMGIPIIEEEELIGTLLIRDSMQDIASMYWVYFKVTGFVMLVSLALGVALASPIQRVISKPLLELANTAQKISKEGNYSLRVRRKSKDEIGVLYREFNMMLDRVQESDENTKAAHQALQTLNEDLEDRVESRTRMLQATNDKLEHQMKEKDRATNELKQAQDQLIEASRKAGMADVANGVLHNIGNVLNSLNVSASVINESVRSLPITRLQQCVDLMGEHRDDIGTFMAETMKGKMLPEYLANLSECLEGDRLRVVSEIEALEKNVEHIKDIVRAQQSYAGSFGLIQVCQPSELMEDALQFASDSIRRHRIELLKDYLEVPDIEIEKSRLIQMLVNLIKNAKEATLAQSDSPMQIKLRIDSPDTESVRFEVSDQGVGIAQEQITAIFSQGFTTKKHGHGFGLHASANAAKEMGGSLRVHSDGVGKGATFTIDIPVKGNRQRTLRAPSVPSQQLSSNTPVDA